VVVVALIACGAWYFIREMSTLQTRVTDAEKQTADADIE
jgi:hypothetical protein